jgi:hypothetical protein
MAPDLDDWNVSRANALRLAVGTVALALLLAALVASVGYSLPDDGAGTVDRDVNGSTLVGVQGFHWQGQGNKKKPPKLAIVNESAGIEWTYDGSREGISWFYDTDPLPNGNVLVVNTHRDDGDPRTLVYELDPETRERVWQVELDLHDTHDVDLINGDQLLVANMRNYDAETDTANDRVLIYDIGAQMNGSDEPVDEDDAVWEWYFKDHYPADTDGGMNGDWTHVNDVDKVGDGEYLVSPRNFDQVILLNRSTNEVDLRLGEDDDHDVLYEQHNPMYLETEEGEPVILVADSENNRVVEYTCSERTANGDCEWELTWELDDPSLNWPRDADRLPNGNTLVVDSLNHRVVEVTPDGEIVWESFVFWGPYDAERIPYGDESGRVDAPAMADLGQHGEVSLSGSSGKVTGTGDNLAFYQFLERTFAGTPAAAPANSLADTFRKSGWARPAWVAPWSLVHLIFFALVVLAWALAELVYQRRRVRRGLGRAVDRLRG